MDRMESSFIDLKFSGGKGGEMLFTGYGAVFGNVDSYGDSIVKGAFSRTIHEAKTTGRWPALLEQHGGWGISAPDLTPRGVFTEMEEDDVGLKLTGKLADTARGRDLYTLMKMSPRPAIDGLSIGYKAIKWSERSKPDEPRRKIEEIKLFEVSLVTFPANLEARVGSVKSAIDEFKTLADAEGFLRAGGMSKAEAVAFVSQVKLLARSDSGAGGDRSDSGSAELIAALKSREIHVPT